MIPVIMLVVVLLFTAGLFVCALIESWDGEATGEAEEALSDDARMSVEETSAVDHARAAIPA